MKYEAVLWDLDGTLIESTETYNKTLKALSERFCFSIPETVPVGACIISVWESLVHHKGPQLTLNDFIDKIHEECIKPLAPLSLRRNINEVVKKLYCADFRQSCVSNSMTKFINTALIKTEISSYFHHYIGRDSVETGKPSPMPYLKSSANFQIDPKKCIVIEHTSLGIEAAKKAGMTAVAYLPEHSIKGLIKNADYMMNDIRDIYGLLELNVDSLES